jgi:hypothetical protein
MGKYSASFRQISQRPRPWEIHPVWSGIGCLLLILLPILSFAAARLLVQENMRQQWVLIPRYMWYGFFIAPFGQIYLVDIAIAILLLVVFFGLLTVIYSFIIRIFNPRYGS